MEEMWFPHLENMKFWFWLKWLLSYGLWYKLQCDHGNALWLLLFCCVFP